LSLLPLPPGVLTRTHPLVTRLDLHLAVAALLAGAAVGELFTDNPHQPGLLLACRDGRFYFSSLAETPDSAKTCAEFARRELLPGSQFMLWFVEPQSQLPTLMEALTDFSPRRSERITLEHFSPEHTPTPSFPAGYQLRFVDSHLLGESSLQNLAELEEELTSERSSVDEFLERSFGLCLVYEQEIAAWCLSEYNLDDRCEVGIATAANHQRKGLATNLTWTFLREAYQRGIRRVGWHAWLRNEASVKTALAAGFTPTGREEVFFAELKPAAPS
jgi:RimJ/RimL family protein N-acetyltransferase